MKRRIALVAASAAAFLVAGRQASGVDPAPCDWAAVRMEFDTNQDGRLDATERERLRLSRPMGFTCDPGRGIWDGGGERKARGQRAGNGSDGKAPPPHLLARFDLNRNGLLDATELSAARAAMKEEAGRRPARPSDAAAPETLSPKS